MNAFDERNRQEFLDAVDSLFGSTPKRWLSDWLDNRGDDAYDALAYAATEAAVVYMGEEVEVDLSPIIVQDKFEWPDFLYRKARWNPFPENSTACSLLAVLCARLEFHEEATGAQDLAKVAVSFHFAWLDFILRNEAARIGKALGEISEVDGEADAEQRNVRRLSIVKKLAQRLIDSIKEGSGHQAVERLAESIAFVLDAFLMVREKREEMHAPQVDVRLPVTAAWRTIYDAARSEGVSPVQRELLNEMGREQKTLAAAASRTQVKLVNQLEDAGKFLGRGSAILSCMEPDDFEKRKDGGPLVATKLYENHEHAPLSRLYSLRWSLPEYGRSSLPEMRLVLYPSGALSISIEHDPVVEYFLGSWRYVDLDSKSGHIARLIAREAAGSVRLATYRLLRFSHQLAYHQHGATLVLELQEAPETGVELEAVKAEWRLDDQLGLQDNGDPYAGIPITTDLEEDSLRLSNGRLAYGLALHDGQTRWAISGEKASISVIEFRAFPPTPEDIDNRIDEIEEQDGVVMPRQLKSGSRHRAAFSCSLETEGVVLCVSQDGFITAFYRGVPFQVR